MSRVEDIKSMIQQYNKAQQMSLLMAPLRKKLVPLLKENNMTKTKFNFGDRVICYHSRGCYEEITQGLIKKVIREKYPQLNAEQFVTDLYDSRKKKTVETLKVHKK